LSDDERPIVKAMAVASHEHSKDPYSPTKQTLGR
jgi:hypothetical protein